MGLKYVLENEVVYLLGKGGLDVFAFNSISDTKTALKCMIRSAEESTAVESLGGKQILPSFNISFNGKVPVKVGDSLEVEGVPYTVLTKRELKDLSRNVLVTKVTI